MGTWEATKTVYRVSDFISWQRAKTLVLSPSFQRRPVWQHGAKSYLIDTVVRGLPMPIIFLREKKSDPVRLEPMREIVDGQQRMRTIFSYVDPSLLGDFKPQRDAFTVKRNHNKELAGKTFSQLDPYTQQKILDYQFSVHVLPSQVDDREILEIFARMNATGIKLNEQELRNAYYFGEFKSSMYQLASEQLQRWRDWNIFTEYNIARMEEVEITSEFAIVMLKGLAGKTQSAIGRIYKDKDEKYPERQEVEQRFRNVMDMIDDKLGKAIRFLPFRNKTLFYHLFSICYDLQFGIGSSLNSMRPKPIAPEAIGKIKLVGERIEKKTAPVKVLEAVARRTTNIDSRRCVLDYLRSEVKGA